MPVTIELSKDRRREVCIHEAAHAVIFALGGIFAYGVKVAPVGATPEWTTLGRKGTVCNDLLGLCETSDNPVAFPYLRWNAEERCMEANRESFQKFIQLLRSYPKGKSIVKGYRRNIRSHVCGTLAGLIADQIVWGAEEGLIWLEKTSFGDNPEDYDIAEATCRLLPFRNELDYLASETERLLRTPKIWAKVLLLADALEEVGEIGEGIERYLPQPLKDWPRSPRYCHK